MRDAMISGGTPVNVEAPRQRAAGPVLTSLTRDFLICGLIAGPFYVVVGLVQALTRPGFNLLRHDLSLLANGEFGWIQIANLVLTGLLVGAFALGLRRMLTAGRGRTWGPILMGVYGVGLVGAGFFVADPAFGFPPGTPADAHAMSWHGFLHFVFGGVGFLALIAACFVIASRFAAAGRRAWAVYSRVTGVVFLLAFVGIAAGSGQSWSVLGFWAGVLVAWAWLSILAWRLLTEPASAES